MAEPLGPGSAVAAAAPLAVWTGSDEQLACDYHLHTSFTDGSANVEEMAVGAAQTGLRRIAYTEHVRSSSTFHPDFTRAVRGLSVAGLEAYVGAEAKLLDRDGTLDCSAETAAACDLLVGSVHSPPGERGATAWRQRPAADALRLEYECALSIVHFSRAHVLGHPLGMVITHFQLVPADELRRLACACRESGKAFELNARYCPSPQVWLEIVTGTRCTVSLGSDAHMASGLGAAARLFRERTT